MIDFASKLKKNKLYTFPPAPGAGAQWLVRTNGGTHDPNPISAHGATEDEALARVRAMLRYPVLR